MYRKSLLVVSISMLLHLLTSCAGRSVEYKVIGLDSSTPSCQISETICVPTFKFRPIDYAKDEMLLTYDSDKPSEIAEQVLKKYHLRAKRSDDLTAIKTTMITAATNGQDPFDLVTNIKKQEKEVDASTNNFFSVAVDESKTVESIYPLNMTGIPTARVRTGGKGIVIGMIDTPVDLDYKDSLQASIERIDLVPQGSTDNRLHGTEVAGVIVSNNPRIGIAPEAKLVAISAFALNTTNPAERLSSSSVVAHALEIAMKQPLDILNLSFAGPSDPIVDKLVTAAVQKGIVVVAAAGNGGPQAQPAYPAALPGVIAVTAVDKAETIFPQANRGDYIDIAAPGVGILTTAPGGAFRVSSGTSLATAHVSGLIALLMSVNKAKFSPQVLYDTAINLGPPGRDNDYGYGLISAEGALSKMSP